jgi:hypothetical protein
MDMMRLTETYLAFAETNGRCCRLQDDPIPDPEPAAPSLGYPDPEIFHHSPSLYANTIEHQPPDKPQ